MNGKACAPCSEESAGKQDDAKQLMENGSSVAEIEVDLQVVDEG